MANKFGPTRGELKFRVVFSICGLLFMGLVLGLRGWPAGPAAIEILIFGVLFFGGSLIWSVRALMQDRPDR